MKEIKMKKLVIISLVLLALSLTMFSEDGFEDRPITTNINMPTGYTLNRGEFQVGIGPVAFGISDRVQVGTNVLLFLLQDYNVNFKTSLIKNEDSALAAGLKLHHFDLEVFGSDSDFTSITPFAAYSKRISAKTMLHLSGQYSFISGDEDIEDAEAVATSSGSLIKIGLEYQFSNRTRFLAEGGYDFTFDGLKLSGAVLWGWKRFRLRLGIGYFNPENSKAIIYPSVGLWWRFGG
jgi:hypothetical protein